MIKKKKKKKKKRYISFQLALKHYKNTKHINKKNLPFNIPW